MTDRAAPVDLLIDYCDARGNETRRRIRVSAIYEGASGDDVLRAFDLDKRAVRAFRADRILGVADPETGEVFDDVDEALALRLAALRVAPPPRKRRGGPPGSRVTHYKKAYNRCRAGMAALVWLARCDGSVHAEESECIVRFCQKVCEPAPPPRPNWKHETALKPCRWDADVFLAFALTLEPDYDDFARAVRYMRQHQTSKIYQIFRAQAEQLLLADGVLDPEEVAAWLELDQIEGGE